MAAKRKGLGKGLGALITEVPVDKPDSTEASSPDRMLKVSQIVPNQFQPRQKFHSEPLDDLVASIKVHGVLQPLVVRQDKDHYELIAGERRFRASQVAGLEEVPVIIRQVDDQQALELAMIENLQREDLDIIEEAEGYRLMADKFKLKQEQIAERVGKGRATVANALRILTLPEDCLKLLGEGALSAGHAKVILGLGSATAQIELAKKIVREGLSVRAAEDLVSTKKKSPKKPRAQKSDIPQDHIDYLVERLHQHLGSGVRLQPCKTLANGKKAGGKLEIDFYSPEELDRLLEILGLSESL